MGCTAACKAPPDVEGPPEVEEPQERAHHAQPAARHRRVAKHHARVAERKVAQRQHAGVRDAQHGREVLRAPGQGGGREAGLVGRCEQGGEGGAAASSSGGAGGCSELLEWPWAQHAALQRAASGELLFFAAQGALACSSAELAQSPAHAAHGRDRRCPVAFTPLPYRSAP
jgi:hypothetical protein